MFVSQTVKACMKMKEIQLQKSYTYWNLSKNRMQEKIKAIVPEK